MRTIAISDIHGHARTLIALLEKIHYEPTQDRLYLLGDYVDGGPDSLGTVRMVMDLCAQGAGNTQALGGNHDELFLNWLDGKKHRLLPYAKNRTGGLQTITSFWPGFAAQQDQAQARSAILHHYAKEITFLRTLPDWLEDDRHIYVHAGIDPKQPDWKSTSARDFRWLRGRFHRADGTLNTNNRTVIFGHDACSNLHGNPGLHSPWFGSQIIGIDGGIKFGGHLNALLIDESGIFTSASLPSID